MEKNETSYTDFKSLAALPEFTRFSHILYQFTGIPMSLSTPDCTMYIACKPEIRSPICRLIRNTPQGVEKCKRCNHHYTLQAITDGKPLLYHCHAGFYDMIVPIFVQGSHVANMHSGQILAKSPNEDNFVRMKTRLKWLDADDAQLRQAYFKSPYFSREKVKQVMELLKIFAVQLCESLRKIRELELRFDRVEIRKAKEFIAEHYADPELQLQTIATHAGLSRAYFSHVFKSETGVALTHYLRSVRLNRAQELLHDAHKSVTEICYACGFNTLTSFFRDFKSEFGLSPGQYRKQKL